MVKMEELCFHLRFCCGKFTRYVYPTFCKFSSIVRDIHRTTVIEYFKEINFIPLQEFDEDKGDISNIVLGLECGGSDPTSGLASNPTIGHASTKLVELGGSSILSETTEVIGAEHLLAERFADQNERAKFLRMVGDVEKRAVAMGVDLREGQPTPGNKEGGISTIEEKSLGCIHKAGVIFAIFYISRRFFS